VEEDISDALKSRVVSPTQQAMLEPSKGDEGIP
jgi:hypothetical protein